jgi:hypothetical protein
VKKNSVVLRVSSVFSVVKKTTAKNAEKPQRTRRRKGSTNSLKPVKRLERSFFSSEKTDKMFRKDGSNPWKNAPKPLERRVRPLVKLTKCIGRTAQTSGRNE